MRSCWNKVNEANDFGNAKYFVARNKIEDNDKSKVDGIVDEIYTLLDEDDDELERVTAKTTKKRKSMEHLGRERSMDWKERHISGLQKEIIYCLNSKQNVVIGKIYQINFGIKNY